MYADMENWSEIRRRVLVEGVSRRQILRETGMHWRTLRKMLKHSEPPGYQQSKPRAQALPRPDASLLAAISTFGCRA